MSCSPHAFVTSSMVFEPEYVVSSGARAEYFHSASVGSR